MASFKCPYCEHFTVETGGSNYFQRKSEDKFNTKYAFLIYEYVCGACKKSFYKLDYTHLRPDGFRVLYPHTMHVFSYPEKEKSVPQLPGCVPIAIQNDFREAYQIREISPKAAATLARRCLQGMIRDFYHVTDKKNLWAEI